ncbi:uncharacterized protein LOC143252354 [Tachypleus tridentatus]|uniref:uncharacterized protein LOC143252354 n=1 Tax=Tachypleus tridentatus TaxID=6853 RepID=UPI003FD48B55
MKFYRKKRILTTAYIRSTKEHLHISFRLSDHINTCLTMRKLCLRESICGYTSVGTFCCECMGDHYFRLGISVWENRVSPRTLQHSRSLHHSNFKLRKNCFKKLL